MVVRKLRKRIAFTLTGILTLIMLGIQGIQYASSYFYQIDYIMMLVEEVAESYTSLGKSTGEGLQSGNAVDVWNEMLEEMGYLYQSVWVFEIQDTDTLRLAQKSLGQTDMEQEAREKAKEILAAGREEGRYEKFWFLQKTDILVMIDGSDILSYYKSQTVFLMVSSCIGFLVVAGCSILIARWLVKPAERAFEQQKQFVSDASHELKTPLAVIGANAQRLQSEIGENKWLNYILEENQRMTGLLKELLTLSKVEDGSGESTFKTVNLSKIVTRALLPYESIAFEREIDFWMNIQEEIYMQGEEEHLRQAVIVLVDNAFNHVSEHGEIKAKLSRKGKYIEISISNTGQEIPTEEQKKIFQRFYRGDKGRSRSENRYGLGLAIAYAIVQRHRGQIEVVSENGRTTFSISILFQ